MNLEKFEFRLDALVSSTEHSILSAKTSMIGLSNEGIKIFGRKIIHVHHKRDLFVHPLRTTMHQAVHDFRSSVDELVALAAGKNVNYDYLGLAYDAKDRVRQLLLNCKAEMDKVVVERVNTLADDIMIAIERLWESIIGLVSVGSGSTEENDFDDRSST